MKDKLKFLIKQSLKKKIDTKWFKIANVIILLALLTLMNIDKIIGFFGGDFNNETQIIVVDNVDQYDLFYSYFEAITDGIEDYDKYKVEKTNESLTALKESLEANDNKIIVVLNPSNEEYLTTEVITYDPLGTTNNQMIFSVLSSLKTTVALQESNLTEKELATLTSPVEMKTLVTNPDLAEESGSKDTVASLLIVILIIPFFFLITMLTQMIGADINEEKSTRGMEIIISNVSPQIHFLSKVISATLFVVIQGLLLIAYAVIGVILSNVSLGTATESTNVLGGIVQSLKDFGMLDLLVQGGLVILIMFLFTLLAYSILAGVLASMTTSIEDYQQLQTPLMIILMIGYYVALMASVFEGALFIKVLAYIPMLSFLIAPVIYLLGQFSLLHLIGSTLVTVICTILMYRYGLRIYKVGILNYSSKKLWKKMFRSLKER